jgi:hypothetical protein
MKNNAELQTDLQNAIKWQPLLNATKIGFTAKKVSGLKALVEKIEVEFPSS